MATVSPQSKNNQQRRWDHEEDEENENIHLKSLAQGFLIGPSAFYVVRLFRSFQKKASCGWCRLITNFLLMPLTKSKKKTKQKSLQ